MSQVEQWLSVEEIADHLKISKETVYRWLEKDIKPHFAQSRDIDQLFKEYVDLRSVVLGLKKKLRDPVRILKTDKELRDKFFLEMTYHSNAIEGSRMTEKETEMAFEGKKVRGKEIFEILEAVNHKNALEFLMENIRPNFKIDDKACREFEKAALLDPTNAYHQFDVGRYFLTLGEYEKSFKSLRKAKKILSK